MFDQTSRAEPLHAAPTQPVVRPSRPVSVVTITLIATNVAIFVLMIFSGVSAANPGPEELVRWGADFGPLTMGGQWWRLLTACFLHFGIVHIAFNMYVLYQVGISTELIFGRAKYLLIYLFAGIFGNLVSLFVHPMSVGAGASGAIFGVYGAFLGFLLIKRQVIAKPVLQQMTRSAATFLGINLVFGLMSGSTDLSAHIAGLVSGFLLGCFFSRSSVPGMAG